MGVAPVSGSQRSQSAPGACRRRSGVFWPFWRLIEALNAEGGSRRMVVLENVTGLLKLHQGAAIAAIRQDCRSG
jgi:site-specific DNA-cytosine methylase